MSKKQRILSLIPILTLLAVGFVWLVRGTINDMVSERSDNATETVAPELPSPEDDLEDIVAKAEADPKQPGTPLNETTRQKLGVRADEEEQLYFAYDTVPNDPIYPQWYTSIINAPLAWDTTTGGAETLVAVIDSGYALAHEDLIDAWYENPGESGTTQSGDNCWSGTPADKQTNGCDDDGNGYVDDYLGWDFSNNDNLPQAGDNSLDGATHGTKVAGLVGARGNNSLGVASVNWQTKIMPLQGLFDEGYGYSSDIANAIVYAVDSGAEVINLSLGSPSADSIIRAAVRYAYDRNVIVVASSGNCGAQQTQSPCLGYPSPGGMGYPARYPETLAVGATTEADVRAGFSSYGPELDIVAPGSGTIQTPTWTSFDMTSAYAASSFGTSFSSPIVSGSVAGLKALFPEIGLDDVRSLLTGSADKVGDMGGVDRTDEYGWGRLDLAAAFAAVSDAIDNLDRSDTTRPAGASSPPQIVTNIGHSAGSAINTSNQAVTYCVTTPNTSCELELDNVNSSTVITLGSKITNAQGIAIWRWNRLDVGTTGTFDAAVTANGLQSESERLIIN